MTHDDLTQALQEAGGLDAPDDEVPPTASAMADDVYDRLVRLPFDERWEVLRRVTATTTENGWLGLLGGPLSTEVAALVERHQAARWTVHERLRAREEARGYPTATDVDEVIDEVSYDFLAIMRGPEVACPSAVYGPSGVSEQAWVLDEGTEGGADPP